MRYSAFISYNHKDRRWAQWLHRELERYRLPKALVGRPSAVGVLDRRLPPVFQDREELAASTNLARSVQEALRQSHTLIVICSKNGAKSKWVNEEVRQFAALGRRDRIQCVIIPEAEPSGEPLPELDVLPPALLELGHEPLAADARKTGDGKRAAFLKLVAGIINVRYDDLRQRDHARRQRQLLMLATTASAGFIVMAALTVFAFVSRADAVRQRDVARQQTLTAQRTTDFVKSLFQVSDPSESKGQSITALEVLDRGAREIQSQLGNEPDVKAELISTLSEVYMGLGSYRKADGLIHQSLSIPVSRGETRARQIGVFAASQSLQANYDMALASFDKALEHAPEPTQLRDPSLYSRLLVGKAEALAGLDRYPEALKVANIALKWDDERIGHRSEAVARDLEVIGLTSQFAGDLPNSRKSYQQALAIRLSVNGQLNPTVSQDLNNLGTAAYLQHDSASAEGYWRQALAIDEQILGPNHPDVGIKLNNLGRVSLEQRKFAQASDLLTRSAKLYLAQRSGTRTTTSHLSSRTSRSAKEGLRASAETKSLMGRALRAAEVHNNRLIAPILVDLANLKCARGDYAAALADLNKAAPIMKRQYPSDAWRSAWVDNTLGACLLRSGDLRGKTLLRVSSPIILQRWALRTLYGAKVEERLRAVK